MIHWLLCIRSLKGPNQSAIVSFWKVISPSSGLLKKYCCKCMHCALTKQECRETYQNVPNIFIGSFKGTKSNANTCKRQELLKRSLEDRWDLRLVQSRKAEFQIKYLPKSPCPPHKLLGVMLTSEIQRRKAFFKLLSNTDMDKKKILRICTVATENVVPHCWGHGCSCPFFLKWDSSYVSHQCNCKDYETERYCSQYRDR